MDNRKSMKRLALFCMLFLPLAVGAQKQYILPTASASDDEKDRMPRLPSAW